jgi:hypothetical protein
LETPLETQVAALSAVIEALADVDLDAVSDTELHAAVVGLGVVSSRLEAPWCRLIGRWDRRQIWTDNGSKAAGARLARETHRRRSECDRLVHRARDLAKSPVTEAAYQAGDIYGAHVDLICTCDREWRNAEFTESEELLVNLCRTPFFGVAARGIEYWKQCADLDAADRDADSVHAARHLSASVTFQGAVAVDGVLDPLGGEVFKTELDRLSEQLRLEDLRDGVERTTTQRRADALVEMAMRSATAPADGLRPRPLLTVTIGVDPFNHLCQTAAGTVVAPGLLVPYLSDAEIERIVYDPPNRRFEASWRRRFTGAFRRIIVIRDGHCQHASGCDEPAGCCDVDHIVPHGHGGVACLCNGQLLCAHHNRTVKAATDHAAGRRPRRPVSDGQRPCPVDHAATWVPVEAELVGDAPARAPPEVG